MTCKHKLKYTEKVEGEAGSIYITEKGIELRPKNSSLRTYCADCGVLLKDVELEDYKSN